MIENNSIGQHAQYNCRKIFLLKATVRLITYTFNLRKPNLNLQIFEIVILK
ncbi:hypothetical protein O185_21900 [Photorhabdus temperata J3]|uniref:Uncharacterized protein n=1 Tax=Photorhabdus temperata J3 TaxID=1389415 RepID=U7QWX7_PHOTE|nr:hypothetical protein O185_21900 [Photorhabdus temperata J3]